MKLARALACVLIMSPAIASADEQPKKPAPFEPHTQVSIPLLFGVDSALTSPSTSTGFFFGWRPEVIFMWTQRHSLGFGIGPYVEGAGSFGTHQIWLGGGASVVGYFGSLGVAISGGLDVDFLHADPSASPVVGLFVGYRTQELDGIDLPFGVRVDVRPAVGALPTTIIVSAQLDLALGAVVAFLASVMHGIH
jgi:hypothetical protein